MKDGIRVFVYFNLHKRMFSVKDLRVGRVIAHVDTILVSNATFKVNQKGRLRVLKERVKNVHAGIIGYISHERFDGAMDLENQATYNPYKEETFVNKVSRERLNVADSVFLSVDPNSRIPKMFYKNKN